MRKAGLLRRASFTLLELILAVIIISIFLGIALPLVNKNIRDLRFSSFLNQAYLFFDYAKTASILENEILDLRLDPEEKSITLIGKTDGEKVLKKLKIPERIYFESEQVKISFYPDGTCQEFEIIIFADSSRRSLISSHGFDGKIRIDEED